MSELASVHLRQARGFVQARNWPKALELLDKARVLSRDDRALTIEVLRNLVETYDALGRFEMSAQCRDQLNRLSPPTPALAPPGFPGSPGRGQSSTIDTRWLYAGVGVAAVLVLSAAVWLATSMRSTPQDVASASTQPAPASAHSSVPAPPAALAALATSMATFSPAAPAPPAVASPVAALPAPAASQVRESLLKDTVGMCLVIARFEGFVAGKKGRIDVPIGFGTAFVVQKSGLLLTNNHVLMTAEQAGIPPSLKGLGLPGMFLKELSYTVCFGAQPTDRFVAKVLHRSEAFDMALLKIDRKCRNVLTFSHTRQSQGSEVYLCGFPGAVVLSLNADAMTREKIDERRQKWTTMHDVDAFDDFSQESFNSTLTRGIVSASERKMHDASYVQVDAVSTPGNSGGPVLDANNNVIGMLTWVPASLDGHSYSFALMPDQLDGELSPYLRD